MKEIEKKKKNLSFLQVMPSKMRPKETLQLYSTRLLDLLVVVRGALPDRGREGCVIDGSS